jgi:hypothetical protein
MASYDGFWSSRKREKNSSPVERQGVAGWR